MSANVHEAILVAAEPLVEARAIHRLRFRVADAGPLAFRAGQFISLRVGTDSDDNPILRSYSLASSSGAPELDLIVRWVDGGVGSAWLRALAVGARVRFTGPMGFFVLELSHPGDVVFGATGVGIAPVLPMLRELRARPEGRDRRVVVLWGNRDAGDFFWQRELAELAELRCFVSGGGAPRAVDWNGERGRINAPLVELLPSLREPTFYLVGNGAMIGDVKRALVERGVERKRRIRTESFHE